MALTRVSKWCASSAAAGDDLLLGRRHVFQRQAADAVELGHGALHHHVELTLDVAWVGVFQVQHVVDAHGGQPFRDAAPYSPYLTHRDARHQLVLLFRYQPVPGKHAQRPRVDLAHVVGQLGQRLAGADADTGGDADPLQRICAQPGGVLAQIGGAVQRDEGGVIKTVAEWTKKR